MSVKTLGMKWAVILGVLNIVIGALWSFGQEGSARFDLSDEQTFLSVLVTAGLFVAVAWTWYLLRPPKRSAEEPPRLHESR